MDTAANHLKIVVLRNLRYSVPAVLLSILGDHARIEEAVDTYLKDLEKYIKTEDHLMMWNLASKYVIHKIKFQLLETVAGNRSPVPAAITDRFKEILSDYKDSDELAAHYENKFSSIADMRTRYAHRPT